MERAIKRYQYRDFGEVKHSAEVAENLRVIDNWILGLPVFGIYDIYDISIFIRTQLFYCGYVSTLVMLEEEYRRLMPIFIGAKGSKKQKEFVRKKEKKKKPRKRIKKTA